MKFGLDDKIVRAIVQCLQEEPNVIRVLIFGSRVRGTERYNSDIDIAIFSDGRVSPSLFLKIDEAAGIYKVDLIDMGTLTNDNLRRSIETEGVVIFENNAAIER